MYGYATPTHIAGNVADWPQLGVKLPKPLTAAIDILESLRWVEIGHQPVFDLSGITPENAERAIYDYANELLPSLSQAEERPVLEVAKATAVDTAARAVLREASAAVPGIIEQLTPDFVRHAAAYVDAVSVLPEDLNDRSLIEAGPSALSAFGAAQDAARYLRAVAAWVQSVASLPGQQTEPDPALRGVLRPADGRQLSRLDEAHRANGNQTLEALDKVLFVAAREGVAFELTTLRESAVIRHEIIARNRPAPVANSPASRR
ncbi:hypothetical protein PT015_23245 [Candidatus Mycobacterium wuenschmannii]|uniref:PPE family protein n=1 Tax=Candidatus Mycobacterium wuenschmannii TaxID=3027808 RepID=A0ABY8VVQ0_9MYCO|nr:hypothetical protein [Candidatus Mycobacterium wuenschmannii]WIM87710.1 hypothetical protein PT015_23245 [Candidatus Mycobacterium wuenschmannii]